MAPRRSDQRAARAALQRVLDLSTREQLEVYRALGQELAGEIADVDQGGAQLEERRQAIEALQAVAGHLSLPEGQAPTSTAFRKAAPKVVPDWNVTRIQRAFGRWRSAQRAYSGERLGDTEVKRAQRRRASGRRLVYDASLATVRSWLATKPESEEQTLYNAWAEAENERRARTGEPRASRAGSIATSLGLPWSSVLAVARGEEDLDEARRARLEATSDPRLAGTGFLVLRLGCSWNEADRLTRGPEFPTSVAVISGTRLWERSDLEALADGRPAPRRESGELQDHLFDASQIVEELDLSVSHLRNAIHQKRWDWIPEPSGQVSRRWYWWREHVARWQREHTEAGRRRRRSS